MEAWRTGIVQADEDAIRFHGYDLTSLMQRATFSDIVFLLHRGRLPSVHERALLDAILIGVADHGPGAPSCATARLVASGNRQSLSSAVAAGLLAVGDEHGGAGSACMDMIAAGVEQSRSSGTSLEDAARAAVRSRLASGQRIPGLGHRVHKVDPRTAVLFELARHGGVAGEGVAFIQAVALALGEAGKTLPINIDGSLAAVLFDLGFDSAFGKLVFLIGRVAGLTAEVAEEYAREKPLRIRIPVVYDGHPPRDID